MAPSHNPLVPIWDSQCTLVLYFIPSHSCSLDIRGLMDDPHFQPLLHHPVLLPSRNTIIMRLAQPHSPGAGLKGTQGVVSAAGRRIVSLQLQRFGTMRRGRE